MENLFFLRFLLSSVVISTLTLVLIIIKQLSAKHISVKAQYYIWILFIVMLIIPFIPQKCFSFLNFDKWTTYTQNIKGNELNASQNGHLAETGLLNHEVSLEDFALSVQGSNISNINFVIVVIWGIGVSIYSIIFILGQRRLKEIKESLHPINHLEMEHIFANCKQQFNITKPIVLGASDLVETPIAFGALKTYIILPTQTMNELTQEEIKYILLHELGHYKNKDILMNYVLCVLQIVYWFNPLIYIGLKMMRTDREIACDYTVLKGLDEEHVVPYGKTILHFAQMLSRTEPLAMTTSIGGPKSQIQKRIESIAHYKKDTQMTKFKSVIIFIIISALVLSQAPVISIMASETQGISLKGKEIVYEDLSSYFKGMNGSFVLYNVEGDEYSIHNKTQSMKRVSPNSTYKIYSALMGLEEGVIGLDHLQRTWDGQYYPYEAWNQNQDLYSAMKHSVNWYFQDLDAAIGLDKLQQYFDEINYGNSDVSGGLSRYWMESSLRISPIEQVELLANFYNNKLDFESEHVALVKQTLKLSEKGGHALSGKTGSGLVEGKQANGWFIGYVEQEGQTYIFATYVEDKDKARGSVAMDITLSILKDKGIY